jgi:hypothetical protein
MVLTIEKPDQSQIIGSGKLAVFGAKAQTDNFEGVKDDSGNLVKTFELTKAEAVLGSEVVKVNGVLKIEGTDYTANHENGILKDITFNTAPEEGAKITVEYLYLDMALGGASELSLKEDKDKEELSVDCSYAKIQIEKGATIGFSFKELITVGDIGLMGYFTGEITTAGSYTKYENGASKSGNIAIFGYPKEATIAHGNEPPKRIILIYGAMPNSVDMDISGANKSFDLTAQSYKVIDLV